jgi:hypothetical protein
MPTAKTTERRAKPSSGRRAATSRRKPGASTHVRPRTGRASSRARILVDHDEIRRWAEARGGMPAYVKGTGRGKNDLGVLRIDFPGYSGEGKLVPIDWDDWFAKFDASNLALVVQDKTANGELSRFNKLVSRDTLEAPRPRRGTQTRSRASSRRSAR